MTCRSHIEWVNIPHWEIKTVKFKIYILCVLVCNCCGNIFARDLCGMKPPVCVNNNDISRFQNHADVSSRTVPVAFGRRTQGPLFLPGNLEENTSCLLLFQLWRMLQCLVHEIILYLCLPWRISDLVNVKRSPEPRSTHEEPVPFSWLGISRKEQRSLVVVAKNVSSLGITVCPSNVPKNNGFCLSFTPTTNFYSFNEELLFVTMECNFRQAMPGYNPCWRLGPCLRTRENPKQRTGNPCPSCLALGCPG